jgi:hypothetical protein
MTTADAVREHALALARTAAGRAVELLDELLGRLPA